MKTFDSLFLGAPTKPCSCGSGLPRRSLADAHGVFCAFGCDQCAPHEMEMEAREKHMKVQLFDKPVCDFCSGKPSWRYPAKTFDAHPGEPLPQISEGDWLACDECAALIEKDDREGLAQRGLKAPIAAAVAGVLGKSAALGEIRKLHQGFYENRTGSVRLEV